MNSFEITIQNDPIPLKKTGPRTGLSGPVRHAMAQLIVGQCFYIPHSKQVYSLLGSLVNIAHKDATSTKRYTMRTIKKESGEKTIWIWRTV